MRDDNRIILERALGHLGASLDAFLTDVLESVVSSDGDWTAVLVAHDLKRPSGRASVNVYHRFDPQCSLRMLSDRPEDARTLIDRAVGKTDSRVVSGYATEIRRIRNDWAHYKPISDDDVVRALDTMERMLTCVKRREHLDWFRSARRQLQRDAHLGAVDRVDRKASYGELAAAGNVDAMNLLGNLLRGVRERRAETEVLFRDAANSGHTQAMFNLGNLLHGDDTRRGEAEECYRKAAAAGNVDAMYSLGRLLRRSPRREVEAEDWYRRAADAGSVAAMMVLGQLHSDRRQAALAENWYRIAADAGHVKAMYRLGALLCAPGREASRGYWFRSAAEAGHVKAMYRLAHMLRSPEGRSEAQDWYRKAARLGHVDSMNTLGHMMRGNPATEPEAEEWYRKAAAAGSLVAMNSLCTLSAERGDLGGAEVWREMANRNRDGRQ